MKFRRDARVSNDRSSDLIAAGHGLLLRKFTTGAPNNVLGRPGFHELESIAEGASLANHGESVHFAKGDREFQANHFAHRNLNAEHGRNARFAEVHGVPSNYGAAARINADLDFQLEPGMAAGFHDFVRPASSEWGAHFQENLPDQKLSRTWVLAQFETAGIKQIH